MGYFLVFGLIGTLWLCMLYVPLYYIAFRKTKSTRLWHAFAYAALFSFAYAAFIFFAEGEANTVADQTAGFIENVKIGLPLYLFVFTFLSAPITIPYVILNIIFISRGKAS